jgi:hypothetical protein
MIYAVKRLVLLKVFINTFDEAHMVLGLMR